MYLPEPSKWHFTLRLLARLGFAAIFFAAGSLYQWFHLWFEHPVEITIVNRSGQTLDPVILSFKSGIKGTINLPPLAPEQSITAKYYPSGEGSLAIEAKLQTGQWLTNSESYVEAGYTFRKIVTDHDIKNEP